MKICSCCSQYKSEDSFFKKRETIEGMCKDCKREKSQRPELVARRKLRQKEYRVLNKSQEAARVLKWNSENPERLRTRINKWRREKRKTDLSFRIRLNLSSQLSHFVTGTNRKSIRVLLGCSLEELKSHLERKFVLGMGWDNYGLWHVDHIKPCALFNLTDPKQQKACFHWTNLQPLFAKENRKKSDKYFV